jgi:hypothetical protein
MTDPSDELRQACEVAAKRDKVVTIHLFGIIRDPSQRTSR